MKKAALFYAIGFSVSMFIFWYGGVDLFARGSNQAFAFFQSLLGGVLAFSIGGAIGAYE